MTNSITENNVVYGHSPTIIVLYPFCFWLIEFDYYFFHLLSNTNKLCLLLLYFDWLG